MDMCAEKTSESEEALTVTWVEQLSPATHEARPQVRKTLLIWRWGQSGLPRGGPGSSASAVTLLSLMVAGL